MSFFRPFGLPSPPDITKLKTNRDIMGLIKALAYKQDYHIRQDAARVLGELGDARTIQPLWALLRDSNSGVRMVSVEALCKVGKTCGVEYPLIFIGRRPKDTPSWIFVISLGTICDAHSVDLLISGLMADDDKMREVAALALGKVGDARSVDPLIASLQDPDKFVRENAAIALGKIGDARAVDPLNAALRDSNSGVRKAAAEALDILNRI